MKVVVDVKVLAADVDAVVLAGFGQQQNVWKCKLIA